MYLELLTSSLASPGTTRENFSPSPLTQSRIWHHFLFPSRLLSRAPFLLLRPCGWHQPPLPSLSQSNLLSPPLSSLCYLTITPKPRISPRPLTNSLLRAPRSHDRLPAKCPRPSRSSLSLSTALPNSPKTFVIYFLDALILRSTLSVRIITFPVRSQATHECAPSFRRDPPYRSPLRYATTAAHHFTPLSRRAQTHPPVPIKLFPRRNPGLPCLFRLLPLLRG